MARSASNQVYPPPRRPRKGFLQNRGGNSTEFPLLRRLDPNQHSHILEEGRSAAVFELDIRPARAIARASASGTLHKRAKHGPTSEFPRLFPGVPIHRLTMNTKLDLFLDLFLKSPFYSPVRAVISQSEAEFACHFLGFEPNLAPVPMLSGPPDANGLAPWMPIDSPISPTMILGFEKFLNIRLPSLFKEYLSFKCLICMDLFEGILPDVTPQNPLSWLEWCAIRRELHFYQTNHWLFPLTYGPARISDLCMDTRRPDLNGEYPIVIVRHYELEKETPRQSNNNTKVFNSFEDYFDFLTNWLMYKSNSHSITFKEWMARQGEPLPPEAYYDY